MSIKYVVYGLVDPNTNQLRYVGKSCSGLNRPKRHSRPSELKDNLYKCNWIKSLLRSNQKPSIIIIQELSDKCILYDAEQFWIKYFRLLGCPLTNLNDGGPGNTGLKMSDNQKNKLSKINLGKSHPGHKLTPSQLQKLIAANRGRRTTESTKRKLSVKISKYYKELCGPLLIQSCGKCAICDTNFNKNDMVLDYNPRTKKLRGLLHKRCNIALEIFNDDPDMLANAIKYISIP